MSAMEIGLAQSGYFSTITFPVFSFPLAFNFNMDFFSVLPLLPPSHFYSCFLSWGATNAHITATIQ